MKVDEIALASADERRILFSDVCRQLAQKVPESMIEKDFWVCYVLERIFSCTPLSKILRFKGGTSLSKAHAIIERFSEDVDLILDWTRFLSLGDPNADRSKTKQGLFNELMNETAGRYVSGELRDQIQAAVGDACSVELDAVEPLNLHVVYPKVFDNQYLTRDAGRESGLRGDA